MNNEEDFWSELLQETNTTSIPSRLRLQARHSANKQVIFAIRELYRINEEDKLSVQRAWERIAQIEQQEPDVPAPLRASQPLAHPKITVQTHKRTLKWRVNVLAACIVAALLVGSMVIIPFALSPKQTQATKPLGTQLGDIALGVPIGSIPSLSKIKPTTVGIARWEDPLSRFQYIDRGIGVLLNSSGKIVQIVVWSPFQGKTAEGFAVGMSSGQFAQTYQHYPRVEPRDVYKDVLPRALSQQSLSVVGVMDSHGTILMAVFNNQHQAVQLVLQAGNLSQP